MTEQVMPTPGPWHFDEDWRRLPTIFGPDRKTKIATVEKLHGDQRTPQQEANARLIAAAPTMLLALRHVRRFVETKLHSDGTAGFALGIIDHAISQAVDHQSASASSEAVSEAGDPQSVKRDMEGER